MLTELRKGWNIESSFFIGCRCLVIGNMCIAEMCSVQLIGARSPAESYSKLQICEFLLNYRESCQRFRVHQNLFLLEDSAVLRSALQKDKTTPCGQILGSFLCKTAFLWGSCANAWTCRFGTLFDMHFLKLIFMIFFLSCRSLSPFYKAWLLLPKSAPSIVTTLNTPSW